MFYLRLIATALRSLDSHFLRSLLATVGVLIGVASVVAMMSILAGASEKILADFESLGANLLFVSPSAVRVSGRPVGSAQTLVPEDIDALLSELDRDLEAAAPEALGGAVVKRHANSEEYTVVATSDQYFKIHAYNAASGRVISADEAKDNFSNVVCLGSKVAEDLFGGMDPIGEVVKVRNISFRVIGVMEQRGNVGFINGDECVYIPIKSGLKRFFNRDWLNRITLLGVGDRDLDEVQKRVAAVLRKRHGMRVGEEDDFQIFTQQQIMQNINQATTIFAVVFYSIAGISLIVGGIGIMNIMLVSVTERTREIGVRMAVGARRSDIMLQFLAESLIISLLGGTFGLLLGWMMADLLESVLKDVFFTKITPNVVIVALATSTLVGVVSGLYPAYQASQKDPVEALRYE